MKWRLALFLVPALCGAATPQAEIELMSWEEFAGFAVREPYVLSLQSGTGRLLYYGTGHTTEPRNPQLSELEKRWEKFRPTLVFGEGGVWPLERSRNEAVIRHGEQGLSRWLAARNGVLIRSLEPPRSDEVEAMLRQFPAERLKLYYLLRSVYQHRRMKTSEPVEVTVNVTFRALSKTAGLEGPPRSVAELEESFARHFEGLRDWREAPEPWFNPLESVTYTNDLTRALGDFRDRHMIGLLVREVKRGERVLAVVGSGHVVRQERALRAALK